MTTRGPLPLQLRGIVYGDLPEIHTMWLRWALSVGCILTAAALLRADPPAAAAAPVNQAKALFEEARKLAAANDHAGAIAKYAQSLALDPACAEVHAYKAASHL